MPYRVLLLTLIILLAACSPLSARSNVITPTATLPPTTAPIPTATAQPTATLPAPTIAPTLTPRPDPDVRLFEQSGHTLRGPFRRFWERNGGLAIFGLPLTEQLWIDGHVVQYFERARFEQGEDGSVRLGLVGSEERGADPSVEPQADCRFFAETGHNLCPPFLGYWQHHGGLAIFGLPLGEAEEWDEGLVQRFERARMEQPRRPIIQLARLGDAALARLPGGTLLRPASTPPAVQRAAVTGPADLIAPLNMTTLRLRIEGYSGPATVTVVDRRENSWRQTVTVRDGQAAVDHQVLGALGAHSVVVEIDGKIAGVSTGALRSDARTTIETGQPRFDRMLPMVKGFMDQDISEYTFGPHKVRGYRSPDSNLLWLRDHVHQGKGYAYWESDMRSLLDQFRRFQHPDGAFDDYMANFPWGEVRGRTDVEADNEYLFIEGVYRAWQATGDDAWLRDQIDAMERGLNYIRTSPLRWDAEHRLVKRPFTVDTWDFEYGPPTVAPDGKPAPRHWIDADTKWSIFHGDNTGYAQAMELLARMYDHLGNGARADHWRWEAGGLRDRLNQLSWNGNFFRHMVHLVPVAVPGVDEASQLSLSNAYALNRGVLNQEQAGAIIEEYQRRYQNRGTTFAEWYSIDPPFPSGSLSTEAGWGKNAGEYVNGGIMPLVGGELARGALTHGYEGYGLDILQRYYSLIEGTGGSYLWYHPIGLPGISGPDSLSTDGWGSSAMLAALIEGVAGVRDEAAQFRTATIAPRWSAADDVRQASVTIRYGASDGYVTYRWNRSANGLDIVWTGSSERIKLQLLLPPDAPTAITTTVNGQPSAAKTITVNGSRYVTLEVGGSGSAAIRW